MDSRLFRQKKILWCHFISREIRTDCPGIEFEPLRHDSDAYLAVLQRLAKTSRMRWQVWQEGDASVFNEHFPTLQTGVEDSWETPLHLHQITMGLHSFI